MFLWIAIASALVGIAVVVSIFLAQKLIFNEKVLAEKQKTVSTLEKNNKIIPSLQDSIRVLDTNEALKSVKANETDQTIQVILDALPATANSNALGASLQNKLLAGIQGLTIDTLQVDPVIGVETAVDDSTVTAGTEGETENAITFQFKVTGGQDALKQVLTNLERSIRTVEVLSVRIETLGSTQEMTVSARAFYEPKTTLVLTEKKVSP
jgi:hypothetical protein